MTVIVKVQGCLQKYTNNNRCLAREIKEGTTVETLIEQVGVPRHSVSIVSINDVMAGFDDPVRRGDEVTLFAYVAGG